MTSVSTPTVTSEKKEYVGTTLNNTHTLTFNVSKWNSLWWFIPANLTQSATLPGTAIWWINSTVTNYNIGGVYWTANHMNGIVMGINVDAYWDKPTGLLLRWRYHDSFGLWVNLTLTSVSMESGGGLSSDLVLIAGGAGVVIIIAAVVFMRKRK